MNRTGFFSTASSLSMLAKSRQALHSSDDVSLRYQGPLFEAHDRCLAFAVFDFVVKWHTRVDNFIHLPCRFGEHLAGHTQVELK
jgi:hypothetical protein